MKDKATVYPTSSGCGHVQMFDIKIIQAEVAFTSTEILFLLGTDAFFLQTFGRILVTCVKTLSFLE